MSSQPIHPKFNQGIKREYKKDYKAALKLYQEAADEGDVFALKKIKHLSIQLNYILIFICVFSVAVIAALLFGDAWIGYIVAGLGLSILASLNHERYWYKIGYAAILNLSFQLIGLFILIPLGAIIPYMFGITFYPVTVLFIVSILIVGFGFTMFFFERTRQYMFIGIYGAIVLSLTLVSFLVNTDDKKYVVEDVEGGVEIVNYRSDDPHVVIPKRIQDKPVVSIGERAFYGYDIETVVIPDHVVSIGDFAFGNTRQLVSVQLPDDIILGQGLFYGSESLEEVNLPDSMTEIPYGMFYKNKSLDTITLPSQITAIGSYAFYNNISLEEIDIPDTVTAIGAYAFAGVMNITAIEIPDNVNMFGQGMFHSAVSLSSITLPDSMT